MPKETGEKFIVGTRIGTKAAIVPLVIYTAPFLARLLENSLLDVNAGIIEAAQAMGPIHSRSSFISYCRRHLLPSSWR